MKTEEFAKAINELLGDINPRFLDPTVQNLFINFNCYEPSEDRFVST